MATVGKAVRAFLWAAAALVPAIGQACVPAGGPVPTSVETARRASMVLAGRFVEEPSLGDFRSIRFVVDEVLKGPDVREIPLAVVNATMGSGNPKGFFALQYFPLPEHRPDVPTLEHMWRNSGGINSCMTGEVLDSPRILVVHKTWVAALRRDVWSAGGRPFPPDETAVIQEEELAALRSYQKALSADLNPGTSSPWDIIERAVQINRWKDPWAAEALEKTFPRFDNSARPAVLLATALLRLMRKDTAGVEALLTDLSPLPTQRADVVDYLHRQVQLAREPFSLLVPAGKLQGLELEDIDMSGRDLRTASFADAVLTRSTLIGANLSGADFSGTRLSFWQLLQSDATAANFTGATIANDRYYDWHRPLPRNAPPVFERATFDGARLRGLALGKKLRGATFRGATIASVGVADADLSDADFTGATLSKLFGPKAHMRGVRAQRAQFIDGDLEQARLSGGNLSDSSFVRTKLARVGLQQGNLSRARFDAVDMSGADLYQATGENARFVDSALPQSVWIEAVLQGVAFVRSDLRRANFANAKLANSDFRNTSLEGVTFFGADLRRASFIGGLSVKGADFRSADLRGADLRGLDVSGIHRPTDPFVWLNAIYDQFTYWPDGFDPKSWGAILQ